MICCILMKVLDSYFFPTAKTLLSLLPSPPTHITHHCMQQVQAHSLWVVESHSGKCRKLLTEEQVGRLRERGFTKKVNYNTSFQNNSWSTLSIINSWYLTRYEYPVVDFSILFNHYTMCGHVHLYLSFSCAHTLLPWYQPSWWDLAPFLS